MSAGALSGIHQCLAGRAWRAEPGHSLPRTIDRILHAARIDRKRCKITHRAPVDSLPPGTIFRDAQDVVLVGEARHLGWTFEGYRVRDPITERDVTVLTPQPLLDLFRAGFAPLLHVTASSPT